MSARRGSEEVFDRDLAVLVKYVGVELNGRNFSEVTSQGSLDWSN